MKHSIYATTLATLLIGAPFELMAQQSAEDLAKSLSNPVAALISVPLQYNYDQNIGPNDKGDRHTLNIQPVIPMSISDDWNLISRTILPITHQSDIFPGAGSQTGTGDIVQSLFFSPKEPTANGWILAAGPVFLIPTGSEDELTADTWAAGPTGVALRQSGPWTVGLLFNHLVDFADAGRSTDINSTFIQPFASYTTPSAVTYTINSEATHDWENDDSSIPLNFVVSKVVPIGGQLFSFGAGVRYWADSTDAGPEGFGARLIVTALFPK